MSIGYGRRRLLFWPWHYVGHVLIGLPNNHRSRVFCTWCVDDRMRAYLVDRDAPSDEAGW
jgi:hypothetical protein